MLDSKLIMHEGYEIKIISTSILGGRQMHIDEGPMDAEVVDLAIYRGREPYDIMEDAADIVNAARNEIIDGEVFTNIRSITDHINDIVMDVNSGKGILGALISDDADLSKDIQSSMKSLSSILGGVEDGKGLIGQLLAEDSSLAGDLEASMADLRKIFDRIEQGHGSLGKFVSEDATLYSDLSEAIASLKNISARIERGEGTIGRFIVEDTLYEEVEATVGEVRATIDDFRETAPITAFSSIFFGAF
jgi:hypothetical protein